MSNESTILVSEEYIKDNYDCRDLDGVDLCNHNYHMGVLIKIPHKLIHTHSESTHFVLNNWYGKKNAKEGNSLCFVKNLGTEIHWSIMKQWHTNYRFENISLEDFLSLCHKLNIKYKDKIIQTPEQKINFYDFLESIK